MNHDPRNNADAPALDWTPPSADETARFRRAIDAHRAGYERIELAVTEAGCEVVTDTTGEFPAITLECPRMHIRTQKTPAGWQAWDENFDGDPADIGHGDTEAEAVLDLEELHRERQ